MIRFPNRVRQTAIFYAGTPNYVDVTGGGADVGLRTIGSVAALDGWLDGDQVGVLVLKDPLNYQVWTATWDSANSFLVGDIVEHVVGTLTDSDSVSITAAATSQSLLLGFTRPVMAHFNEQTGTTYTLTSEDAGKIVVFTSSSAVSVTIDDALPVNFHCLITREGTANVAIDCEGTDTLNGVAAGSGVVIEEQWKSAYLYQRAEGAWVANI